MRNHSFPEISCIICSGPLDLSLDLSADENGKAVHEECYVNRLVAAPSHKTVIAKLFDFVPPVANSRRCRRWHDLPLNLSKPLGSW
jgi:hypothetical protein